MAAALSIVPCYVASAQTSGSSATLARDVNGFHLGMTVAEARAKTPLEYIGGDQFEAVGEGITYNFGVSPLGRIYRVSSTQELGSFAVDRAFVAALERRLTDKYGKPDRRTGSSFYWVMKAASPDGTKVIDSSMRMYAEVSGWPSERTLEITLIDFRIRNSDEAEVNRGPRSEAEARLKF